MAALLDRHRPEGPVLDLGCGSGDLAIHLARLGYETLGVDFVEAAIEQANRKREMLSEDVARRLTFRVGDAAKPSTLGMKFGAVLDSGFLHLFDPEESARLVEEVAGVLVSGGRYYLHEFSVEFPAANVPRAFSGDEARARFTDAAGWRIVEIASAVFLSAVADPVPAVAACVERL